MLSTPKFRNDSVLLDVRPGYQVEVNGRAGCIHRLGQNSDNVRVLYDDDGSKAWVKLAENKVVRQSAKDQPTASKATKGEQQSKCPNGRPSPGRGGANGELCDTFVNDCGLHVSAWA
eukprot:6247749-Pyramimonas_sp.AAC.2